MWIFLLILGVILIIAGIICGVESDDSYNYEELLIVSAFIGIIGGLILSIWSIVMLCSGDNKTTPKTEVILTDSTEITVVPDSIYAIQYIVTWKDEDGVVVGNNIKLLGNTEKNIGDTITINLK